MKKLALILCLTALTTGAFAQGVVNFLNGASSLISQQPYGGAVAVLPSGAAGTFHFGLLLAPHGTANWSFSGTYATNLAAAGVIFGKNGVTVTGWTPGTVMDYKIAGWSSDLGPTFLNSWLTARPATGYFGESVVASGAAGGTDPVTGGSLPPLNLFGASPSLTAGFVLIQAVPEPTAFALAGLGAAALLIFRRRK